MGIKNSEFGRGGDLNTIVGKGSAINGDMDIRSSLRIDGKVRGNITAADTVIVGKEGVVEGIIKAKHVLMAGKVKGNIIATGKVLIESTSSIFGDIKASRLVVDEGALFDGKCSMAEGENGKRYNQKVKEDREDIKEEL